MSADAIAFNEVFKSATEATSLASTDRVIMADSNGALKKISRDSLVKDKASAAFSAPKWVRFATCSNMGSALFSIDTNWGQVPGIHLLIDLITHPNSGNFNDAAVLSRLVHSATNIIDKLRVVRKSDSPAYVDFHYNAQSAHMVYVQLISGRNFTLLSEFQGDAEIPDGYTAKEFDMSASSPLIVGGG